MWVSGEALVSAIRHSSADHRSSAALKHGQQPM